MTGCGATALEDLWVQNGGRRPDRSASLRTQAGGTIPTSRNGDTAQAGPHAGGRLQSSYGFSGVFPIHVPWFRSIPSTADEYLRQCGSRTQTQVACRPQVQRH
jgi:hypothetical protein